MYTHRGTSVCSLIRMTFVESAQNLTPGKSQGGSKSEHILVTPIHLVTDHARSCLTWALESDCSRSAPLALFWTFGVPHIVISTTVVFRIQNQKRKKHLITKSINLGLEHRSYVKLQSLAIRSRIRPERSGSAPKQRIYIALKLPL